LTSQSKKEPHLVTALETLQKFIAVRRMINLRATKKIKPLGLGLKQAFILLHLHRCTISTAAHLAECTTTDPATITRATDSLAHQGFVSKKDAVLDRRAWALQLTAKGEQASRKILSIFTAIAEDVLQALSAHEREQFSMLLGKMLAKGLATTPRPTAVVIKYPRKKHSEKQKAF
jgi:DNA-binding MarR family transcriptional regulator